MAVALNEPPAAGDHDVAISAAKARVPERSAHEATYALTDEIGGSVRLPWRLNDGRLPHNAVESVQRWTNSGIQVRLADGLGYRLFKALDGQAAWPMVSTSEVPESSPSVDTSVHSGVGLSSAARLSWRPADQSYLLTLEATDPGLAPAVIGPLGVLGNPIDDPKQVRPAYLREGRVEFVYGGTDLVSAPPWEAYRATC